MGGVGCSFKDNMEISHSVATRRPWVVEEPEKLQEQEPDQGQSSDASKISNNMTWQQVTDGNSERRKDKEENKFLTLKQKSLI